MQGRALFWTKVAVAAVIPALLYCSRTRENAVPCGASTNVPPPSHPILTAPPGKLGADTAAARDYVTTCVSSRPPGTRVAVPARETGTTPRWQTAPYTLAIEGQRLRLGLSFRLSYPQATTALADQLKERMKAVRSCLVTFFRRHGIALDLSFDGDGTAPRIEVRAMAPRNRYDMLHWAFGIDGVALENDSVCTTIAHEVGHHLGLADEYETPPAGDEDDDSVMRYAHCDPERVRYQRRHLQVFLAPLCDRRVETAP